MSPVISLLICQSAWPVSCPLHSLSVSPQVSFCRYTMPETVGGVHAPLSHQLTDTCQSDWSVTVSAAVVISLFSYRFVSRL